MIGNFGEVEVFSLHATKICNAMEGGFAATNDDDLVADAHVVAGVDHAQEVGSGEHAGAILARNAHRPTLVSADTDE